MNLKEAITIGFAAVVVLALFVFVLMNRGSEKVITAVIPITVAAIVAIGLSIAIFGVEPAINEVFPTAFQTRLRHPPRTNNLLLYVVIRGLLDAILSR